MELNKKQEEALNIILKRWQEHQKYTTIAGYAGTGKSSLVKFAIAAMHVDPDKVVYATYTGKAADVLRKKGNDNVMTLHKLLYNTHQLPNGTFIHTPVKEIPYSIVIVDECSMVPKNMVEMLMGFYNVYTIYLGDDAQLPPVKSEDNGLLENPHAKLTEIMRQGTDSGIIDVATAIRTGTQLSFGKYGNDAYVGKMSELSFGMLEWADIVITFTNAKRNEMNKYIRKHKGFTEPIEKGDKLICLHNEWERFDTTGNAPLINGMIGTLQDFYEGIFTIPDYMLTNDQQSQIPFICGNFINDNGETYHELIMDKANIITGNYDIDGKILYKIKHSKILEPRKPLEFTYGYAITAWKAQGSEWDKVLVLEESFPFDPEQHRRALYTAATRSSKNLVILR